MVPVRRTGSLFSIFQVFFLVPYHKKNSKSQQKNEKKHAAEGREACFNNILLGKIWNTLLFFTKLVASLGSCFYIFPNCFPTLRQNLTQQRPSSTKPGAALRAAPTQFLLGLC